MAILASYVMISDTELAVLLADLPTAPDVVEQWASDGAHEAVTIDTLWDALHVALTGVSASEPEEDDPLSEAVVGVEVIDEDEEAPLISVTTAAQLVPIVRALRAVTIAVNLHDFEPGTELREETYPPGIWDDDRALVTEELTEAQQILLEFYDRAIAAGLNVVTAIA